MWSSSQPTAQLRGRRAEQPLRPPDSVARRSAFGTSSWLEALATIAAARLRPRSTSARCPGCATTCRSCSTTAPSSDVARTVIASGLRGALDQRRHRRPQRPPRRRRARRSPSAPRHARRARGRHGCPRTGAAVRGDRPHSGRHARGRRRPGRRRTRRGGRRHGLPTASSCGPSRCTSTGCAGTSSAHSC